MKKKKKNPRSFQQIFRKNKWRKCYTVQRYKFGESLFLDDCVSHQYYSRTKHLSLILKGFIPLIVLWFYCLETSLLILFIAEVLLTIQLCPLPQAVSVLAALSLFFFCRNIFLWLLWQLFITHIYKSTSWYHCSIWAGSCDSLPYATVAAAPVLLAPHFLRLRRRVTGKERNKMSNCCSVIKSPLHHFPPPPLFWRKMKNSRMCWWLLMREKRKGMLVDVGSACTSWREEGSTMMEQWIITVQREGLGETRPSSRK